MKHNQYSHLCNVHKFLCTLHKFNRAYIFIFTFLFLFYSLIPVSATEPETTYPVTSTSNHIEGWPDAPDIFSSAAVVMEAETGTVLYDKNMNEQLYPASITKLLTAILTVENCSLNEMVSFSDTAVFSVPRNSSHIAITPGEELSVENCLYGLLLASANEVANALGEHISGSIEKFVALMNKRAAELGAINSHFENTNGLPDEKHYTTCYDMAMISRAAVFNDTLIKINSTTSYMIPPTNLQPESRPVNSFHYLLLNGSSHYEGCFGGKTGYTTAAGNTLVTFAKRDGVTLICVVMKSDSEHIYSESAQLLDYGFNSFQRLNISEHETTFDFTGNSFFDTENSIFESTYPRIALNQAGYVVLPIGADFTDTEMSVSFRSSEQDDIADESTETALADIIYTYNGHFVGSTTLDITYPANNAFSFAASPGDSPIEETSAPAEAAPEKRYVKINLWYLLYAILILLALICLLYVWNYTKYQRRRMYRIYLHKRQAHRIDRRRKHRKNYPTRRLH